ncbi:MAG: hypothetical protein OXI43_12375 [Candidatus Poribacteria bacterium]|nr:hypothetical protein [Candidatus Poribacteria bacterium]
MRFIFHKFAALMAIVLTFSDAAAQEINAVNLETKAAAERDADTDINKLLWFGAGMGVGIIGTAVGVFAGCAIGSRIDPPEPSGFLYFQSSTGEEVGTLIGAAAGCLLPLLGICSYPVHPPSGRFIGKSPEYVELYTNTYKAKVRSLRTKFAAGGVSTGCGLIILSLVASVAR